MRSEVSSILQHKGGKPGSQRVGGTGGVRDRLGGAGTGRGGQGCRGRKVQDRAEQGPYLAAALSPCTTCEACNEKLLDATVKIFFFFLGGKKISQRHSETGRKKIKTKSHKAA